jgi:hypothetical protein
MCNTVNIEYTKNPATEPHLVHPFNTIIASSPKNNGSLIVCVETQKWYNFRSVKKI